MHDEDSILGDMDNFFDTRTQESSTRLVTASPHQAISTKALNNLEIFYSKLESLGINLAELRPILDCQDNNLILSGAGSGKTTALILKIIRDLISGDMMSVTTINSIHGQQTIQAPAKILVSTFLKSGAQELQLSFRRWCQKLGVTGLDYSNIYFRTIHAEVKDALEKMGVQVSVLEETNSMIRAVMNSYNIRSVTATSRSVTIDEVNDMAGIITYARNRLDAKRYDQPLMQDYQLNQIVFDAVLKDFKLQRKVTGKLDFEDMQELLLEALSINPNVVDFIGGRYDFVFVDEFQDVSQLQYEILKHYFNGAKRVIAIGDDDQVIYSWRGSDSSIIGHKFEEDLNPTVMKLSTNYRCKSNILNPVIPSIEKNIDRHAKQLRAYAEGGEVNIVVNGNVNLLVDSMKQDLGNDMKVGILARVNSDLLIPALILELDGGLDFGLSKSVSMQNRLARQVFGCMDLVTKRITDEFESFLRMFVPFRLKYEAENLCNVLAMNRGTNLYTIPMADLQNSVPNLAPLLKGLRSAKEVGGVEAYIYLLDVMDKMVFTSNSTYAKKAKDLVGFVRKLVLEHDKLKGKSIEELDRIFNQVLPERLSRRIKYGNSEYVKLSTVHEAKGKEWDSVYIWNDVEGVFPNQVGNREITPEEFEEERRVHYIAWTRAKTKLTVFTDRDNQGPFLKECDLSAIKFVDETTQDMSTVFKRRPAEHRVETDTLLRRYITYRTENGGITDEAVANIEIVTRSYTLEDLVERLDNQYGVHLDTEDGEHFELFDSFFSSLADEIFSSGNYGD